MHGFHLEETEKRENVLLCFLITIVNDGDPIKVKKILWKNVMKRKTIMKNISLQIKREITEEFVPM